MPDSPTRRARETGIEIKHINVWMLYSNEIIQYHCFFCDFHKRLWRTQQRAIEVHFGEGSNLPFLTPPISIACPACGTIYHIQGFNG